MAEVQPSKTADGVEYTPHSMMHKAIVRMDETKLEMLEGFERVDAGHKFVPSDSNVRVLVTGRNWLQKRVLIYGSTSTDEAKKHVDTIIDRIHEIDFAAELVHGPIITNIAVSGDFCNTIDLEKLSTVSRSDDIDVEYEPEQFPAAIVKLQSLSVMFLLFSTGRFVIQGLKDEDEIEPAIESMQARLEDLNLI